MNSHILSLLDGPESRITACRQFTYGPRFQSRYRMIATLDRLMALAQKLRDAEKHSERDPIYVAVELNELRLLTRLVEDYLGEANPYSSSTSRSDEAYN